MASWLYAKPAASVAATATEPVAATSVTQAMSRSSSPRRSRMLIGDAVSTLEPERDAADRDLVAAAHPLGALDAHTVHQRAVRAAEVFDPPLAVPHLELRVSGRCGLVRQRDVVSGVASHRVRGAQRKTFADPGRSRGAALDDKRPERPLRRALDAHRSRERAEGPDQEEIEEYEERDPHSPEERGEGDLHLIGRAEQDLEAPDGYLVAIVEDALGDAPAVHVRAVGALQVVERVAAQPEPHLSVL